MPINATLYPGVVSIYGSGNSASIQGFVPPTSNFLFGVVDQTWGSMADVAAVGRSVMFKSEDVIGIIVSSNWPYTLIPENKIILIEDIPV